MGDSTVSVGLEFFPRFCLKVSLSKRGSGHRFHPTLDCRKWESDVTEADKMLRTAEQELTPLQKERAHLHKMLRGATASRFAEAKVDISRPRTPQRVQHATFYPFGVSIGWRPSFDHVLGFTTGLE